MTEPELPEELRDPFRASGLYTVPLSTLVAGAYVGVTDQMQLQQVGSPASDWTGGPAAGGGGGDDGD